MRSEHLQEPRSRAGALSFQDIVKLHKRQPPAERSPGVFEIDLGNGRVALIDAQDLPLVEGQTWRSQAGKSDTRYACNSRGVLMHRAIMGDPDHQFVDHINSDGLDNRRSNLRLCSPAQNNYNFRKRAGLTSRFKGVSLTKDGRWRACIKAPKRGTVHLGQYADEEIAAKQYDRAARLMFGAFAKTNADLGLLA